MTRITAIHYAKSRRELDLTFADDTRGSLSAEFLRVHSPSAEVRGHGPGQETLQTGKATVEITELKPIGHYAIQPVFSDGHDSGIFSWEYLHELTTHRDRLWAEYLDRLDAAGASRDPDIQVLHFTP